MGYIIIKQNKYLPFVGADAVLGFSVVTDGLIVPMKNKLLFIDFKNTHFFSFLTF